MARLFRLTKYVDLVITRASGKAAISDTTGLPTPATTAPVTIQANIQPFKLSQTKMLEAAERTKEWINVYSEDEIRKMKEGAGGWDADRFTYNDKKYKVMEVENYRMGVLNHYHARAALDSPTPRSG